MGIYGRIFGKNENLPKVKINDFKDLTPENKNIHKFMIRMRNKIFAHSDAIEVKVQVHRDSHGKLEVAMPGCASFIKEHSGSFKDLFEKLLEQAENKLYTLLNDLYDQDDEYKVTKEKYLIMGYTESFWKKYLDTKT